MGMKIRAAIKPAPSTPFVIEDVELDDIRNDEILVKLDACGICHTDVMAQGMTPLPAVLGHEGCGIVQKVGSAVTDIKPNDRVILTIPHCGSCSNCQSGKYHICEHAVELGFSGKRLDGTQTITRQGKPISSAYFQQSSFATYAVAAARNAVPVDVDIPSHILAAIPCGILTGAGSVLNVFRTGPNDSLAVFGTGAVGLSAVMAGRMTGARPIIAIDIVDSRLNLALELGATHTINAQSGDIARQIRDIVPGGVSFAFETSSNEQALKAGVESLAMGGTCGIVTIPNGGNPVPFSFLGILDRAATIKGILMGEANPRIFLPKLLEFYRQGRFPYDRLIRTYPFPEINQAFEDSGTGIAVKPVLVMS